LPKYFTELFEKSVKAFSLLIGVSLLGSIALPVAAQPRLGPVERDVVCYHFKNAQLMKRDLCKVTEYENLSVLTWSDGVSNEINWSPPSRYATNPLLDGVVADSYKRNFATLERIRGTEEGNSHLVCVEAIESKSSVCFR
jgi:hypothetical protein